LLKLLFDPAAITYIKADEELGILGSCNLLSVNKRWSHDCFFQKGAFVPYLTQIHMQFETVASKEEASPYLQYILQFRSLT
jgi:hypothetical protein